MVNRFIGKMLELGAELDKVVSPIEISMVINDAEILYNNHIKELSESVVSKRSFNKLELLAEDLECAKMWLNDKKVPTHDKDGNEYSVVGRMELLLKL